MKLKITCRTKPNDATVLEGPVLSNDEESDLWNHGYVMPTDHNNSPARRWGNKGSWCRPSCIPISIILILIFLVVLLPLLDQATEKALQKLNAPAQENCQNTCRIQLVESIPDGLVYPDGSTPHLSTYDAWMYLINEAKETIEIGSFYWSLRLDEIYPDPTSKKGDDVFKALLKAGTQRDIKVKIAQSAPSKNQPNTDTEYLMLRKAAEVRSLNFEQLMGGGVLHSKLWVVDRRHFYVGSANMDWRALTQVKEMGLLATNCSCLAEDVAKIFDVYWMLGMKAAKIPDMWPKVLETEINMESPMNLNLDLNPTETYIASSPLPFSPAGRTFDLDAIINVMQKAEKFIYIAVMDYVPLIVYEPKVSYWSVLDNALRSAAIDSGVEVRLLVSQWNHTRSSQQYFLKSLADITDSYPKVSINIRKFEVPANAEQAKIPFARVNHNKYMVTDNTAYVGTSNWSGDYFTNTAGIGFVLHESNHYDNESGNANSTTIRAQLQAVFERDWNSHYSHPIGV
ncbi:PREDICTED: phospholipase D3 isoform X2 [Nicrophorus vespilloides]|uniref:Phospholipase D3 isoform X2 n=1 Tax=Nicrophorus vespilloides TaxID=110193 RepID=A0ABM1NAY4_NICVS|nr:PREDICTED: phospholipase D3 isoform X2 [Nicrophorus vespilloides]